MGIPKSTRWRVLLCLAWATSAIADPATQPAESTVQIVKATWQIPPKLKKDVTKLVASKVQGDRLDFPVDSKELGSATIKGTLTITYKIDGKVESKTFRSGEDVWIASFTREEAAVRDELPQLRKEKPKGLVIVSARYGRPDHYKDVTEVLRTLTWEESLTIPVGPEAFGRGASRNDDKLEVTYSPEGTEVRTVSQQAGSTLQIGKTKVPVLAQDGGLVNLREVYARDSERLKSQLVIFSARFGVGDRRDEYKDLIQSAVTDNSLTLPVKFKTFNVHPTGATFDLDICYSTDGKKFITTKLDVDSTLQIGQLVTAFVPLEGGLVNCRTAAEELRTKQPTGLLILEARYGFGDYTRDVTDKCRNLASGNSLNFTVSDELLGSFAASFPERALVLTYYDGTQGVTVKQNLGGKMKVTSKPTDKPSGNTPDAKNPPVKPADKPAAPESKTSGATEELTDAVLVSAAGGGFRAADKLRELRPIWGDGLIILDAQFGAGNRWADVRELIQKEIRHDSISMKVGERWPDPFPGGSKNFVVHYWNGSEVKTLKLGDKDTLEITGQKPEPVKAIGELPRFLGEGQKWTKPLPGKGKLTLLDPPAGLTISPARILQWTPTADAVGVQDVRLSIEQDGRTYYYFSNVQIVSKAIAQAAGGDGAKLEAYMRLDVTAANHTYTPGLGYKTVLMLRDKDLLVLKADGMTIQSTLKMPKVYTQIAQREQYFVAVSKESKAIDLIDAKTLTVRKSVKLPFADITDMVLHPNTPITYAAVDQPGDDEARFRVVVVDEAAGTARESKNLIGKFLAIDPNGEALYTGFRDYYRKGTRYFMNPDGRIWDTPELGNIDILMVYSLAKPDSPKLARYKDQAGANGSGVRLSPDGKKLTYLSFTGYPLYTKSIPAWDPSDLQQIPTTYACKDKGDPTKMTYHPSLPLVAVPGNAGPLIFNRDTGDEEPSRVSLPKGVMENTIVEQVYFSPDGRSAIVQCQRGPQRWLYRVPLNLSADEIKTAERGVQVPPPKKVEPVKPDPNSKSV